MSKGKKYIITESQYRQLVKKKMEEKLVVEKIMKEINRSKKSINESAVLNEAIVDTLKKYFKKGLLTTAVMASLLANNVQAQDLSAAGVPEDKIEMAQKEAGQDINIKKLENQLMRQLKRKGQDGAIRQWQSLSDQQKENTLNQIAQSGKDINDLDITFYLNRSKDISGDQIKKIGQESTITVDTVFVDMQKDFESSFEFNSAELKNPEQVKEDFQKMMNTFYDVDEIIIVASSSTLRNKGDFENLTWKEASQARVNVVKNILVGMEYNLGGCGENESKTVTENMVSESISGENGDGTSGPQSPMEASQIGVDWYTNNEIPAEFWDSQSEEAPYASLEQIKEDPSLIDDYKQHQYVKVVIKGQMIETETNEIVTYDFVKIEAEQQGVKLQKVKRGNQKVDISSCPVKI